MATLIKTGGTKVVNDKSKVTLEDAQRLVGGYVQMIRLSDDTIMLMNEDGKLMHLPVNEVATTYAHLAHAIMPTDFIVGDVIICNKNEF